jgi:hypothetical protein
MATEQPCVSLLSLPNEILTQVCELASQSDRYNLLTVCNTLYKISQAVLYSTPAFTSAHKRSEVTNRHKERVTPPSYFQAHWVSEFRAAFTQPGSSLRVVRLEIDAWPDGINDRNNSFGSVAETFHNLRSLVVHSIYSGTAKVGEESRLLEKNSIRAPPHLRILPNLTRCTLELRDLQRLGWFLDCERVFLSSTIKSLTLVGCTIWPRVWYMWTEQDKFKTPLEELVFRNCRLSIDTISCILELPRRLRKLVLDSGITRLHHKWRPLPRSHTGGSADDAYSRYVQEWVDAVQQQKRSLEHFEVVRLETEGSRGNYASRQLQQLLLPDLREIDPPMFRESMTNLVSSVLDCCKACNLTR